jgi:enoyl-CoA hydratase/carnithine racemase
MAFSKPVIAAVEGYAVAGGLELALMCDLRVAARSAIFGVFCRRWGVPLIDGGTIRLPRVVGMGRALDLILTGRAVGADEALAMGLANRVTLGVRESSGPGPTRWATASTWASTPRWPSGAWPTCRSSWAWPSWTSSTSPSPRRTASRWCRTARWTWSAAPPPTTPRARRTWPLP